MAENTLKKAVDDWEKEADRLIDEPKKVSSTASKEFDKQLKTLQDEGTKLVESIRRGARAQ